MYFEFNFLFPLCLYFGLPKCSCMQVKSVFLDGLPATWDEKNVHELFKKYGEIESVQLARNMPTAKRKDFGFICFSTREAALACIDAVNEAGIGEGNDKVLHIFFKLLFLLIYFFHRILIGTIY